MNESRFYKFLIGGLILSNIILLMALILGRPKHARPQNGPKQFVINHLSFDDGQVKNYEKLIEDHSSKVVDLNMEVHGLRETLFSSISSKSTSTQDSLIKVLAGVQTKIEMAHIEHFGAIRGICNQEQAQVFDDSSEELGAIFSFKPPKGEHKPPGK